MAYYISFTFVLSREKRKNFKFVTIKQHYNIRRRLSRRRNGVILPLPHCPRVRIRQPHPTRRRIFSVRGDRKPKREGGAAKAPFGIMLFQAKGSPTARPVQRPIRKKGRSYRRFFVHKKIGTSFTCSLCTVTFQKSVCR